MTYWWCIPALCRRPLWNSEGGYLYLATDCPNDSDGQKDVKSIAFVVSRKRVCLSAWIAVLSISSSRFYEIRKEFEDGKTEPTPKRSRSMSVKSQQAIAWMSNYFERVGDTVRQRWYIFTYLPNRKLSIAKWLKSCTGGEQTMLCVFHSSIGCSRQIFHMWQFLRYLLS